LSGGTGTRFGPVPIYFSKPFMKFGGKSIKEQVIEQGQACGTNELLIVTYQDHLFLTQNLVGEMRDPPSTSFLLKLKGRNTALTIALAALSVTKYHGSRQ
jgi:mannose-1-phosphate guanylyltransferase / mannose-6-phosphate isomerase